MSLFTSLLINFWGWKFLMKGTRKFKGDSRTPNHYEVLFLDLFIVKKSNPGAEPSCHKSKLCVKEGSFQKQNNIYINFQNIHVKILQLFDISGGLNIANTKEIDCCKPHLNWSLICRQILIKLSGNELPPFVIAKGQNMPSICY